MCTERKKEVRFNSLVHGCSCDKFINLDGWVWAGMLSIVQWWRGQELRERHCLKATYSLHAYVYGLGSTAARSSIYLPLSACLSFYRLSATESIQSCKQRLEFICLTISRVLLGSNWSVIELVWSSQTACLQCFASCFSLLSCLHILALSAFVLAAFLYPPS